jgi:carbamate kinase
VYLHYKRPDQSPLRKICSNELREYLQAGHFPPGNMGPKIESVLRFLHDGGKEAIITSCDHLSEAVRGTAGTHIFPDRESMNLAMDVRLAVPIGGR